MTCFDCGRQLNDVEEAHWRANTDSQLHGMCARCFIHFTTAGSDWPQWVENAVSIPAGALPSELISTASLLMQAVVIAGDRTSEGELIKAVAVPWRAIIKRVVKDPTILYQIDPRRFEELIAGWYKEAGFDEVILTPRSGDHGRDVIAVKNGIGSVRFLDSIKRYGPGHLVTADDVRALLGVLHGDLNATKGIVTTSSDFAPKILEDPAIAAQIPYRLELVNGVELVKRLDAARRIGGAFE
jgi:restriction system protein